MPAKKEAAAPTTKRKAIRCLRVALLPGTEKLAEVKAQLIEKGHVVTVLSELADYDLVLGEKAHRLGKYNEKLLKIVIKSARTRLYGSTGNTRKE